MCGGCKDEVQLMTLLHSDVLPNARHSTWHRVALCPAESMLPHTGRSTNATTSDQQVLGHEVMRQATLQMYHPPHPCVEVPARAPR
jgi:hypothetical protein